MIFETLSLEYFLAGKTLPWNKVANPEPVVIHDYVTLMEGHDASGMNHLRYDLLMIKADASKAKSRYFNLKG